VPHSLLTEEEVFQHIASVAGALLLYLAMAIQALNQLLSQFEPGRATGTYRAAA
jgi:hypothetical protein